MKFGKPIVPPLRATRNKGSASVYLPNREALAELTHGTPDQQALSNYAKLTPSGRNGMSMPDIIAMGSKGAKVE